MENISWEQTFSESAFPLDQAHFSDFFEITDLMQLKQFLDMVQIKHCLVKPYWETYPSYPLVESRELLPSFDSDIMEYSSLPGFSMIALNRPINYFQEVFQFDILHPVLDMQNIAEGNCCPLESAVFAANNLSFQNRLPKAFQEPFRMEFANRDICLLETYPSLMPYLMEMDRAQVMAKDRSGIFHLAGIYASFPSDLDAEIKRFGVRIGKFKVGDAKRYERNRLFVYQYLMELYGFPIVSERRTSSALFARRLHKMVEKFLIRVLGQTDRCITSLYSTGEHRRYPHVEKIALVQVDPDQTDILKSLSNGGYFVDAERRVIILRVLYKQHNFNPNNVRQDRALSVERQDVIHPLTGNILKNCNIIKDTTNLVLRLNDIVRGEYTGRILYKRNEVVENTDTEEKRLKFLFAWLSKHQRRIIGYSDEFYANVVKVLDNYLLAPENYESFDTLHDLYQEVLSKYSYIQQARKVRVLEDIRNRHVHGEKINYLQMLTDACALLHELKFEIAKYFDVLVVSMINLAEFILNDRYIIRNYIEKKEENLSPYGKEIRRNYRRLVALTDEFKAIRKSRKDTSKE